MSYKTGVFFLYLSSYTNYNVLSSFTFHMRKKVKPFQTSFKWIIKLTLSLWISKEGKTLCQYPCAEISFSLSSRFVLWDLALCKSGAILYLGVGNRERGERRLYTPLFLSSSLSFWSLIGKTLRKIKNPLIFCLFFFIFSFVISQSLDVGIQRLFPSSLIIVLPEFFRLSVSYNNKKCGFGFL